MQVGGAGLGETHGARVLLGTACDQVLECAGLLGEGGSGLLPGLQKLRGPGQQEAALTGLEVDDQPLQPVGGDQDVLGLLRAVLHRPQFRDRGEQHGEGGTDHQGQQAGRDHRANGQTVSTAHGHRRASL
ncbi:hypothetical protein GCM10009554_10970 [Kribbella koreensis]|uniref:Uncharacterized protein n=1 Tax=Kribbella koreensis TaxID=57909 RepID=A0ABN1PJ93_9ACTN